MQSREATRRNNIDPWPFNASPEHPGYGLHPERVVRIFRESECGYMRELQDLYDDLIESDGHLRSLFESRIAAVSSKGLVVQPGGPDAASIAAADAMRECLEDKQSNVIEFVEHHLEAQFRGFSCSEIDWQRENSWIVPARFINVPHSAFRFEQVTNAPLLVTKAEGFAGEHLLPDQWVISSARHSNLARGGLFRTATWWALFKRLSVRDWIIFAERFGIPYVIGTYRDGETSPEARAALEDAIKDLGEAGQAILEETTRIVISEIAQRSGDNTTVHPEIVALCNAEISKLFTGSTLSSDNAGSGGASFALGKVHENRSIVLEIADAARFMRTFRKYVSEPFMRFNGFGKEAKPPILKIPILPTIDPKTKTDIASVLVNELGLEIDGWQVAEEFGFRRPLRPEDAAIGVAARQPEPPADEDSAPDDGAEEKDMGDDAE